MLTCNHAECQRDACTPIPCRYPDGAVLGQRPHTAPLPTCPECLARAAYLADLTDTHLQTLFDPDTSTMARRPSEAHVHLWAAPHHGIALCECDTRVRWLEATMQGWHRAWSALKARYGSYDCKDRETGECWQYVGTCYPKGHCFRHRALPPVGDRVYFHVPELPGDFAPALEG